MEENTTIGVDEASQRLQTSTYTIRHFCDAGYIPHIKRNYKYQRILTPEQFELLAILVKMKESGFKKTEIKRYARLSRLGRSTASERLEILTTKKHQLQQEIKDCQDAIAFIERQEELERVRND